MRRLSRIDVTAWIPDIYLPIGSSWATHNSACISVAELVGVGLMSLLEVTLVQYSKGQLSKLEAMIQHFTTVDNYVTNL